MAYVIEAVKLAAGRSFRRTVNLSGRFGAECPGAMLDGSPGMSPHTAPGLPFEQQGVAVSTTRSGEIYITLVYIRSIWKSFRGRVRNGKGVEDVLLISV